MSDTDLDALLHAAPRADLRPQLPEAKLRIADALRDRKARSWP